MISINVIGLRSRPLRVEGFYTIFLSNNTLEAKPNNGFKESTELTVDAMQYCQAILSGYTTYQSQKLNNSSFVERFQWQHSMW